MPPVAAEFCTLRTLRPAQMQITRSPLRQAWAACM
nr:MAG TPA: hypothetical protein [Caudoviricetes sp.]